MAVLGGNSQNNTDPNQQQQDNTNAPIGISGNSAGSSAPNNGPTQQGAQNNAPNQGQNTPTQSGRFSNLQNYLTANSSNSLGQGLANQVQQTGNNINQGISTSYNNFQDQSNAGRNQTNDDTLNQASSNPYQYLYGTPTDPNQTTAQNTAGTNSSGTPQTLNQGNYNNIEQQLNGEYTGPQQLTNYDTLNNQYQNYNSNVQQAGSDQGRMALLNQYYNASPNYSSGQQSLDNMFIQSDPNQMAALNGLQANNAELGNTLQNTNNQAQTLANQYTNEAAQTNQNALAALSGAVGSPTASGGGITGDIYNQFTTGGPAQRAAALALAQQNAGLGELSNNVISQNNLTPGEYLYGVDLGQYITPGSMTGSTITSMENASQNQNIGALAAMLSGNNNVDATTSAALQQFNNPSDMGTFDPNAYTFDTNGFNSALAAATGAYNTARTTDQTNLTNYNNDISGLTNQMNLGASGVINNVVNSSNPEEAARQYGYTGSFGGQSGMYGVQGFMNSLTPQQIMSGQSYYAPIGGSSTNYSNDPTYGLAPATSNMGGSVLGGMVGGPVGAVAGGVIGGITNPISGLFGSNQSAPTVRQTTFGSYLNTLGVDRDAALAALNSLSQGRQLQGY